MTECLAEAVYEEKVFVFSLFQSISVRHGREHMAVGMVEAMSEEACDCPIVAILRKARTNAETWHLQRPDPAIPCVPSEAHVPKVPVSQNRFPI